MCAWEKSRIRETKHLSTDADSSTDAIGGWTKTKSGRRKKRGNFRPHPNKNVQMLDHFFPLLFPKDSESLKILDIQLWEVGEKRPLNGTSKVKKVRKKTFFCESLKILDIRLWEVGAKRPLNGTSKVKKVREKNFFCVAIFDNFQTKMFISETTSFYYFSPRIPNL